MEIAELRQDLKEKYGSIEDIIYDAYDNVSSVNCSEVRSYNDFLNDIEETCRQMRK